MAQDIAPAYGRQCRKVSAGGVMRGMLAVLSGVLLGVMTMDPASAAGSGPSSAPESLPVRQRHISFRQMGWYGPVQLRGVEGVMSLPFGIRLDEVVTGATLRLRYTYSPSLIQELSHLRILINNEVVLAIPLTREQAGQEVQREVPLDPRWFVDYNILRMDFIGHYTWDCEDPVHSSLWASISEQSALELTIRPLTLGDDLAMLPAPFFDPRDNRRLELAVVLPRDPSGQMLQSAGVVASWFGAMASYRSARFPVTFDQLPERHALVFMTERQRPAGLDATLLPAVQVPTISIMANPVAPELKLLVVQGRDDAQLKLAADALVLGQYELSGSAATVDEVDYGEPRHAYDTPNWIRTDGPVKFGELVETPHALQTRGYIAAPIRLNIQVPPDLLMWDGRGVPLDVRYRYTPPVERDNSMLVVSVNDRLLRAFHLRPDPEGDVTGRLVAPFGADELIQDRNDLDIPASHIGARNQLSFQFLMEYQKRGWCRDTAYDPSRGAVDPDSTIDFSGFPHYARMPDLGSFANAGFPFSKYGDLAETAILVSKRPPAPEIETMLFLLGRFGRMTGVPATRYELVDRDRVEAVADRDILVVAGSRQEQLLASWQHDPKLVLERGQRELATLDPVSGLPMDRVHATVEPAPTGSVRLTSDGALAALVGFESPMASKRSVVALLSAPPGGEVAVGAVLEDEGRVGLIRGDTTVIRGEQVVSFESEPVYFVGHLDWWTWLRYHLSQAPLAVVLIALLAAVLFAFWAYGALRHAAARRLPKREPVTRPDASL